MQSATCRVCECAFEATGLQPGPGDVTRDDVLDRSVFAFIDVPAVLHLFPPELLDQLLLLPLVLVGWGLRRTHADRVCIIRVLFHQQSYHSCNLF